MSPESAASCLGPAPTLQTALDQQMEPKSWSSPAQAGLRANIALKLVTIRLALLKRC